MEIHTEKDITSEAVKYLREQSGLSQRTFWKPLGVGQSGGSRYERGRPMVMSLRTLVYAIYVAGIKIDATTPAGAGALRRLAKLQEIDDANTKSANLAARAQSLASEVNGIATHV
jgi:transcriptional regulator with XRE-family HTH domain